MANVVSRGQVTGLRRLGLPAEAASFLGRRNELAGITALLRNARMVTVTGPGGVGKTRTSLAVAALVADDYPDGVWFADLGGAGDPALLAEVVAAALGVPDDGGSGWQPAVLDYLRPRKLLLILDTCEHLVDACAEFADTVLRAAPLVTLLATSRQPLDSQGEHAFPLLPLPADPDAVDLFAQRATAVLPGFAVTPQNRADVLRVCRRLDGIPLAIEFAAVRLRALPLHELASQLESGIRTLTVSRRGTSTRHKTLRAAVEWGYQLCGPAEQALWQRLSVFAGTFDVTGAEQVCAGGALPAEQVLQALVGLVDKSVVLRDGTESPRYRLPGAQREFGAELLAEADETGHFLGRLARWSLGLARDFDGLFGDGARTGLSVPVNAAGLDGAALDIGVLNGAGLNGARRRGASLASEPDGALAAAFGRLGKEYENVRTALAWTLDQQDWPGAGSGRPAADLPWRRGLGADLAMGLTSYWQVSSRLSEGRQWLDRVVSLFPGPGRERVLALSGRGQLAAFHGDLNSALADIGESIRLAEAAGQGGEPAVARGYLRLNLALTLAGRHAEALAAGQTARQRLTACGHRTGLIGLEAQLALLHQLTGDIDEALACCGRGLAQLAAAGPAASGVTDAGVAGSGRDVWLAGYLRLMSGLALFRRHGSEQACGRALRQALAAWDQLGDVMGTAHAIEALGWLAARREQFERAAWLLGAADQLWTRTGRRLSGIAQMEESRERAVRATRRSLGERRYVAAYTYGGALPLAAVVKDATDVAGEVFSARGDLADDIALASPVGAAAALTKREREIAELVAGGLSNREIAGRLFISKRTVDAHVDHIFSKLELSSRVQLTVLLRDNGTRARATGV
jgi:non-specific serine/threonine protein kinase